MIDGSLLMGSQKILNEPCGSDGTATLTFTGRCRYIIVLKIVFVFILPLTPPFLNTSPAVVFDESTDRPTDRPTNRPTASITGLVGLIADPPPTGRPGGGQRRAGREVHHRAGAGGDGVHRVSYHERGESNRRHFGDQRGRSFAIFYENCNY